jgi:hypothetical protein
MIWAKRSIRSPARQGNFATGGINDIARRTVTFDDVPDVSDVMGETRDDEI